MDPITQTPNLGSLFWVATFSSNVESCFYIASEDQARLFKAGRLFPVDNQIATWDYENDPGFIAACNLVIRDAENGSLLSEYDPVTLLKQRIMDTLMRRNDADDKSWGYEEGVLLSRSEALNILSLINKLKDESDL